jgi:hypothetical protein
MPKNTDNISLNPLTDAIKTEIQNWSPESIQKNDDEYTELENIIEDLENLLETLNVELLTASKEVQKKPSLGTTLVSIIKEYRHELKNSVSDEMFFNHVRNIITTEMNEIKTQYNHRPLFDKNIFHDKTRYLLLNESLFDFKKVSSFNRENAGRIDLCLERKDGSKHVLKEGISIMKTLSTLVNQYKHLLIIYSDKNHTVSTNFLSDLQAACELQHTPMLPLSILANYSITAPTDEVVIPEDVLIMEPSWIKDPLNKRKAISLVYFHKTQTNPMTELRHILENEELLNLTSLTSRKNHIIIDTDKRFTDQASLDGYKTYYIDNTDSHELGSRLNSVLEELLENAKEHQNKPQHAASLSRFSYLSSSRFSTNPKRNTFSELSEEERAFIIKTIAKNSVTLPTEMMRSIDIGAYFNGLPNADYVELRSAFESQKTEEEKNKLIALLY